MSRSLCVTWGTYSFNQTLFWHDSASLWCPCVSQPLLMASLGPDWICFSFHTWGSTCTVHQSVSELFYLGLVSAPSSTHFTARNMDSFFFMHEKCSQVYTSITFPLPPKKFVYLKGRLRKRGEKYISILWLTPSDVCNSRQGSTRARNSVWVSLTNGRIWSTRAFTCCFPGAWAGTLTAVLTCQRCKHQLYAMCRNQPRPCFLCPFFWWCMPLWILYLGWYE